MKLFFRLSICAGLVGTVVAGGIYACPQWSSRLGWNMTEWLQAQRQIEEERHRHEALARQSQLVLQCLKAKFQVIEALHAGQLTLCEAAARFRDLSDPKIGSYPELFRRSYAGQSDEERWCRQVIKFVQGGVPGHPDLTPLVDQLEAIRKDFTLLVEFSSDI